MSKPVQEILIIGGGVIGSSIAWHLAGDRANVTLIDKGDLASGSSGACDGLIFMQSKKPGIHLELAMKSLERFKELRTQLPVDIEFHQTGGMVVIETEDETEAMETFVRDQRSIGLEVSLLDRHQALEKEPALNSRIAGASFSPLDAQVNPMALTLGFALGARAKGARIVTGAEVLALETRSGRVASVRTTQGNFKADVVVNAAGAYAPSIAAMVGLSVPITPRRGQIVVTQAAKPLISHCMISAQYIAAKYNPDLARRGQGLSMEQTRNGNLLLGSTREFAGFDRSNTPEGISGIIRSTTRLVPGLRRLQMLRAFAGLRPYTPDGMPFLGPVRGVEGFFMAAGHEGDGIALSPITGELVARMILDSAMEKSLEAFGADRFRDMDKESACHG